VTGQPPPSDEIVVRPYTPEDKSRLLAFIREVWSFKPDVDTQFDNRWWWNLDPPPLLVADDRATNAIVGMCAFMPFTLLARGTDIPSTWFVDFYVLPQYQGKGLGRRLTEQVQDRFPLTASLSQTAMAYRVFARMGWSARKLVRVHMHPLPMNWMFPENRGTLRVSKNEPALESLNRLWERARHGYEFIATRTADELLQRYAPHGGRNYNWLMCHRGDDCAGYVVVRRGRSHGLLVDFLVEKGDDEALGALLSTGVRTLIGEGAGRVYCLATDPDCERLLKSRGFMSSTTPLLGRRLNSQNKYLTYRTQSNSPAIDPAKWYLTLGDCDLDLAW
jgi:GNAT superfamily N-acetyltransferase